MTVAGSGGCMVSIVEDGAEDLLKVGGGRKIIEGGTKSVLRFKPEGFKASHPGGTCP